MGWRTNIRGQVILWLGVLAIFSLFSAEQVASVTNIKGDAQATRTLQPSRTLKLGSAIYIADMILVGPNSALQIQYLDESILELASNTKYLVKEYKYTKGSDQDSSHSQLFYGGMRMLSGKIKPSPDQYDIETPNATLGLLGTLMEANFEDGILAVGCSQGRVQITNKGGTVVIGEGMEQYAIVTSYLRRPRIYVSPPPILIRPNIRPK
ncbi:MAG TPA: FecR family protein [Chlamydiales bacterium]|nr:FecR family protein [Chlamydiales bacterium]